MTRLDWDSYGMMIAEAAALRSEDPYAVVGACILRPHNSIASTGYNGTVTGLNLDWSNRDQRREFVIHAEANALRYVTPLEIDGGTIYATHIPCVKCCIAIRSYGITRAVWKHELDPERYNTDDITEFASFIGLAIERIEA